MNIKKLRKLRDKITITNTFTIDENELKQLIIEQNEKGNKVTLDAQLFIKIEDCSVWLTQTGTYELTPF